MGELVNSQNKLFTPIKLGNLTLKHRIALAPLTRFRATKKEHVPLDIVAEYYGQRASTPGTLLITEATFIAAEAGGYDFVPGIYSDAQIESWKKVTEEVHKRDSFIFLQLWALGRAAAGYETLKEDGYPYVAPSPVPLKGTPVPQELTKEEIKKYIGFYAQAAENAIKAGFDGVEIHGANGYLVDQFIQDVVNKRTDEYGGSIENRSRFGLEVVKAVVDRIGAERTGIRLSPWSEFQEMKMENPIPQFTHFINELATHHPTLAYIHLTEPRIAGNVDTSPPEEESLKFAREAWRKTGQPFLVAGGYTAENSVKHYNEPGKENDVVVFGRFFISNPDIVKRIEKNIPFTPYDRSTFYNPGSPQGYIDYPFADSEKL